MTKPKTVFDRHDNPLLIDKIAMVAAFLHPASGLPQLFEVLNGNTAGVSVWSWLCFMGFTALFFVYSLAHKIKPMIITNFLWLIIDTTIIIAILTH